MEIERMISDTGIAVSIMEIVALAIDEDTVDPGYKRALDQLFGLRLMLRAMGVPYQWHREVAAWEELLRTESAWQLGERVKAAMTLMQEEGYMKYAGLGMYEVPEPCPS